MAQNGPHSHQVYATTSGGRHSTPPTTVAFSLTSARPYLIPDLNLEDRDSMDGGKAEAVEVPPAVDDKGKSVTAADDGEHNVNIDLERERRKQMKDLFSALADMMPHVPKKTDRVTLVGEAIQYIKFLEDKVAIIGKQKLEQAALARQAAARGEASSSSFSPTAMPQTAQGMPALCSWGVPRGWGGGVPVPPAAPAVPAPPMRIKTWTGQNVALTVADDTAYISVCAPRRPNALTMVLSVLDNHRIDVINVQMSSDTVRALFLIYAHVIGIDGDNRSTEEVYQMAVSEIMLRLHNSNSN